MKPNASRVRAACLLLLLACALPHAARGQSPQPSARKFDEFTTGAGGAQRRWWRTDYDAEAKELKARVRLYAAQLRKEGARPYVITYGPRLVGWVHSAHSVASLRAGTMQSYLTEAGFDWRQVNWVNGGSREEAATELWIVPPGAQPPCPTPTVRPEEVAHCPEVSVGGSTYVPEPSGPLRFKAHVNARDGSAVPTFSWSVSAGRIVGGQGTDAIEVELPPGASDDVVAKVELHGYSLECPVASSAAYAKTTVGVSNFKFDEFGDIRSGDTKARLDNFAIHLQEDPTLLGYMVVYGGRHGPRGQAARRTAWLRDYIVNARGIDPARIITVEGGFRDELSAELWLSARGAPAPPVTPTVDEDYVRPKGDVRRRP
jgi:hypothetical protein